MLYNSLGTRLNSVLLFAEQTHCAYHDQAGVAAEAFAVLTVRRLLLQFQYLPASSCIERRHRTSESPVSVFCAGGCCSRTINHC